MRHLLLILLLSFYTFVGAQDRQAVLFAASGAASQTIWLKWVEPNFLNDNHYVIYRRKLEVLQWTRVNEIPLSQSKEVPASWKNTDLEKFSRLVSEVRNQEPNPLLLFLIGRKIAENNSFAGHLGLFYEDKEVENGATYVYKIISLRQNEEKTIIEGAPLLVKQFVPEDPVKSTVALAGRRFVELGWLPESARYLGVNIYRSNSPKGDFRKIHDDLIIPTRYKNPAGQYVYNDYQYSDTLVLPGTTYYYRLVGQDYFGRPLKSPDPIKVTTRGNPLSRPAAVAAHQKANGIQVVWQYQQKGIVGFDIYRSASDTSHFAKINTRALGPETRSFLDEDRLIPYSYYNYRVVARDKERESISPSILMMPADIYPPATPVNMKGRIEGNSIVLSWDKNKEGDLLEYHILRNIVTNKDDGRFSLISISGPRDTSYLDPYNSSTKGVYRYKILSQDTSANKSKESKELIVVLPDVHGPATPSIKMITSTEKELVIEWSKGADRDLMNWSLYKQVEGAEAALFKSLAASVTNFHDSEFQPGHVYSYFLTASDSSGNTSERSKPYRVKAPVNKKEEALAKVQGVIVKYDSASRTVNVNWMPVRAAGNYIVYRSEPGQEFRPVCTLIKENSFSDKSASRSKVYVYCVKAFDEKGVAGESENYSVEIK